MSISLVAGAIALASQTAVASRDYIEIVGSSTVYPFATVVAERFGRAGDFKTPKIESTGSGGGMKLFCAGLGVDTPDITNASRRIKQSELDKCLANGVTDVIEVLIGYDGIAVANAKSAEQLTLSRKDIYLALAKQVPNPDGSETMIDNPYKMWSDVNAALPAAPIEVIGPPPTSGTRDAFAELVLEGGCKQYDFVKAMSKTDKSQYKAYCHSVREDGPYIEAGENDNLIVQKLEANPAALGVFGFSFLEQNADKVQGSLVDGVAPSFDSIADGSYPVSRPLYFYVKKAHIGQIPGMAEFVAEFTDIDTMGPEGYLTDRGLIPLDDDALDEVASRAQSGTPLTAL
ncbi:MAG: PstS family phosphate ABC transporter substrate-binding protein [Pseudomonadota bacterium]